MYKHRKKFTSSEFCVWINSCTELSKTVFPVSIVNHGTIIETRITCKKVHSYMHNSAWSWRIVENAKVVQSYVTFKFSHVKRVVESWLICVIFDPIMFLDQCNKTKLVLDSISYFLELLWEENKIYLKKCHSYNFITSQHYKGIIWTVLLTH